MQLIGYEITAAVIACFIALISSIVLCRKELYKVLKKHTNKYSILLLVLILAFFVVFSLAFVHPTEQLYFDENTYQGIAINILMHGNALWCQYGTGYLHTCYVNTIYHDPAAWSVFIAMAFAIFGIGTGTAYGLQLFAGALSIFAVFLLSSVLLEKKSAAIIATAAFALMPEVFIWSRTQAAIGLPFMMFTAFAFFFFVIFTKEKSKKTLAMFAFSAMLAVFMRVEAILLLPLFAILLFTFGEKGTKTTIKERISMARYALSYDPKTLALLLAVLLLLLPHLSYLAQATQQSYGQGAGQAVVSLSNFMANIGINLKFLLGDISGINFYPAELAVTTAPLAIVGTAVYAVGRRHKNRFSVILLLGLWFLTYFIFYTAFYAGAATYGVDSRFALQFMPPLAILAGIAISELSDLVAELPKFTKRLNTNLVSYFAAFALTAVLVAYPFWTLAPAVTLPSAKMPQQTVILTTINFFYGNYSRVPSNCLVFSFTPDIWYEFNRSSAQVGYLTGTNASIAKSIGTYQCKVLDYGYWCVVPPYHATACHQYLITYNLSQIVSGNAGNYNNTTFYKILNYS